MEDTGKLSNAAGSVATARTHTTGKSSGRRMSASTARTSVHYLSANSRKCLPFFSRGGVQPHKPPMAYQEPPIYLWPQALIALSIGQPKKWLSAVKNG